MTPASTRSNSSNVMRSSQIAPSVVGAWARCYRAPMRLMKIALSSTFLLTLACGGSSGTSMTDSSTGTSPGSTSETGADTGSSTASPTSGGSGSDSLSGTTSTTGEPVTTSGSTVDATSEATTTSPVVSTSDGSTSEGSTSDGSTSKGETGDDTTTGVIKDCMAWQAAFDAEVLEVRGCMNDNECGVEIKGTSCGCTRNWVARLDADLTEFEALVDTANELGCELPFFSSCDCPATDGFECAGGICNWNYN